MTLRTLSKKSLYLLSKKQTSRSHKWAAFSFGKHMNERKAFIDAILDNLYDDTLRLVYCDWLEEQDAQDPQMLFIRQSMECWRLQKELNASIDDSGPTKSTRKLRKKLNQAEWENKRMMKDNEEGCLGLNRLSHLGVLDPMCFTERGLIHELTCRLQTWLEFGVQFCEKHPINYVQILDKEPQEIGIGDHETVWGWWPLFTAEHHCVGYEMIERIQCQPGKIQQNSRCYLPTEEMRRMGAVIFHEREYALWALRKSCLDHGRQKTVKRRAKTT